MVPESCCASNAVVGDGKLWEHKYYTCPEHQESNRHVCSTVKLQEDRMHMEVINRERPLQQTHRGIQCKDGALVIGHASCCSHLLSPGVLTSDQDRNAEEESERCGLRRAVLESGAKGYSEMELS